MQKVLIIPYPRRYFAHELLMHEIIAGNTAVILRISKNTRLMPASSLAVLSCPLVRAKYGKELVSLPW